MQMVARVGVDLAKNLIQLHAVDSAGNLVVRKAVQRRNFLAWIVQIQPCIVAMEACAAAHYWSRRLRELGHDARLIAPQFVAPYRKGGKSVKNDAQDAEAICEAASRPSMQFVAAKTPEQQSILVLHRMRTGLVEERTAIANRLRGLMIEFGVFLPQGIDSLRPKLADAPEDATNEMNGAARQAIARGLEHWASIDKEIAWFDAQIGRHARESSEAVRVMAIVGVGPISASAAVVTVGDARQFKNGRQFASWLGLVPKQSSSGGKTRLGRITKQGNTYLRALLFQGARSAALTAARRTDRLSR